jgi:PelA/Pel-15E family pectate lyase
MKRSKFSPSGLTARGVLLLILTLTGVESQLRAQGNETVSWREAQHKDEQWYSSEEAKRIADNVLLYQNINGGWLKNVDMADPLDEAEKNRLRKEKFRKSGTTIDNGATHTQLRYLAKVFTATGKEKYKESFLKGVDYLLTAQYENGGWPQFYPLRKGYYMHITYNDGAMIGVMELLRKIAKNEQPYSFVDEERKKKAKEAIDKGLEVILATQVKVDGELTVWAAQHDKDDFSPAKARAYELASLSGKESVGIVEYLMEIENPSEEVKQAIRCAVQWFEKAKITGKRVIWIKDSTLPKGRDRKVIEDPSGDPLWGRFNEIGTNRAIFVGRDGVVKYNLNEIERERRVGYSYIDNYAEKLLKKDYPEWEANH